MSEGQKGGEFFTPTSMVKLIVEMIEPFGGRISIRSPGRAVCSCRAPLPGRAPPRRHRRGKREPGRTLSMFGQEKVAETVRLCRMNLAVNGLEGEIDRATRTTRTCTTSGSNSIS